MSAVVLFEDVHFRVGEAAEESTQFRVSEVDEEDVTSVCSIKIVFPENSIVQSDSGRLIDESHYVKFCYFGSVKHGLSLLLCEVSWDSDDCTLVVEVVLLDDLLKFIKVSGVDLLRVKRLSMTLVFHLEGNFVIFDGAFCRTELLLRFEERVVRRQAEEPERISDGVLKVRFHLDVSGLSDVPFRGTVADNTRSLPKVGFVCDDLYASSLCDGDLAGEAAKINAHWCDDSLLVHLYYTKSRNV